MITYVNNDINICFSYRINTKRTDLTLFSENSRGIFINSV